MFSLVIGVKKALFGLGSFLFLLMLAACSQSPSVTSIDQLGGKTFALPTGTVAEGVTLGAQRLIPLAVQHRHAVTPGGPRRIGHQFRIP